MKNEKMVSTTQSLEFQHWSAFESLLKGALGYYLSDYSVKRLYQVLLGIEQDVLEILHSSGVIIQEVIDEVKESITKVNQKYYRDESYNELQLLDLKHKLNFLEKRYKNRAKKSKRAQMMSERIKIRPCISLRNSSLKNGKGVIEIKIGGILYSVTSDTNDSLHYFWWAYLDIFDGILSSLYGKLDSIVACDNVRCFLENIRDCRYTTNKDKKFLKEFLGQLQWFYDDEWKFDEPECFKQWDKEERLEYEVQS